MRKLKYFIPSLILMMIIFSFSSQTGTESSGLSGNIVQMIYQYTHIHIPEFIIRKGAHMSEYALLCLTFIYGFYKCEYSLKQVMIFSLCATFLYACSDEFHQLFIGGRAGQFTDVCIDTSGGIIVSLITYLYIHLRKGYNE